MKWGVQSLVTGLVGGIVDFFTERFSEVPDDLPPAVQARYFEYDPADFTQINWCTFPLADVDAEGHFCAVGTTGSGKTTVLRLLMQSVLPNVGTGHGVRAIVYDAKEDMVPILAGFAEKTRTLILNPFDERCVSWAVYKDIDEPRYAVELAKILVPDSNEQTRFFTDAAREVVTGVIISFILSEQPWSLADVVRGIGNPAVAHRILKKHSRSAQYAGTYFSNKKQCADVFSTINSKLLEIKPVVSCWEAAKEEVSLKDFYSDELILVLGNSESSRSTVQAINRLFFKRACDLMLAMPEGAADRTWFFLDELGDAGRMEGLTSLMKKGRSRGARVAYSFQSISSLRHEKVYGKHETDEILGQTGNRFFGLVECAETADWCSKVVGDMEYIQRNVSYTSSQQNSTTTSYQHVTARAILPSEFMSIRACGLENGLCGVVSIRGLGYCALQVLPNDLFGHFLIPPDSSSRPFVSRSVEAQYLEPWTEEQKNLFAPKKEKAKDSPDGSRKIVDELRDADLNDLFD